MHHMRATTEGCPYNEERLWILAGVYPVLDTGQE